MVRPRQSGNEIVIGRSVGAHKRRNGAFLSDIGEQA
jgi:hypothetical protein